MAKTHKTRDIMKMIFPVTTRKGLWVFEAKGGISVKTVCHKFQLVKFLWLIRRWHSILKKCQQQEKITTNLRVHPSII